MKKSVPFYFCNSSITCKLKYQSLMMVRSRLPWYSGHLSVNIYPHICHMKCVINNCTKLWNEIYYECLGYEYSTLETLFVPISGRNLLLTLVTWYMHHTMTLQSQVHFYFDSCFQGRSQEFLMGVRSKWAQKGAWRRAWLRHAMLHTGNWFSGAS
jgi:hypothetical protein